MNDAKVEPVGTGEAQRIAERYERRKVRGGASAPFEPTTPHLLMMAQERERALAHWIRLSGIHPSASVLEVGCGQGGNLAQLIRLGFQPSVLTGVELLQDRAVRARELLPSSVKIICGDALNFNPADQQFDVVLAATVFSSILDGAFQAQLALHMWDLLRPGGQVLIYDFTVNNPWNRDVRGVPFRLIRRMFPHGRSQMRRVTLAPPIARVCTALHPVLYTACNAIPLLRSHVLVSIRKPLNAESTSGA